MGVFEDNMARLNAVAGERNLLLNPDEERVTKVAGLMAENFQAVGEYVCPCKQKNRPPVRGAEILCPCPELDEEIKAEGHCHCRLFYKRA